MMMRFDENIGSGMYDENVSGNVYGGICEVIFNWIFDRNIYEKEDEMIFLMKI